MRGSSFYVENGSYLRLQNMQIGYTLPSHICQKSKLFSSCRFYVSGQNIFTLTGYSGLDPELGINNPLDMGVDTTRYPSSRTFTFGVNLHLNLAKKTLHYEKNIIYNMLGSCRSGGCIAALRRTKLW